MAAPRRLDITRGKWSAFGMKNGTRSRLESHDFSPLRRALLAAFGSVALLPGAALRAFAQARPGLTLRAVARTARLRPDLPPSPIWALEAEGNSASLRFRQGEDLQVSLLNELPALSAWNWVGFDGLSAQEPLSVQKPMPSGGRSSLVVPLRQAGTFLIDARLLGDGKERPSPIRPLVVEDTASVGVDRDEVLLIEDWRLLPDGRAIAPGSNADGTAVAYTVNGQPSLDIKLRPNERLRLRLINGCQRAPIGMRIENADVRVMAIDSQPAEPFVARDGQLVLAPGARTDVFIDATQPPGSASAIVLHDGTTPLTVARLLVTSDAPARSAPLPAAAALSSAHLPAQLDLKNATRVNLQLDANAPWTAPAEFAATAPPAFQIKRGRVAVVAITNTAATPVTFRLHGHHFRLLDRLDDGWKPFWLDTLLLTAGQTQRIAFLAEHSGQWLIEAAGIAWQAPKLVRLYSVT